VVGLQPYAPTGFTPRSILVLIFRGWVDPRAHGSVVSLGKKSPATPLGIDPETSRLAAQCLNHYATPCPLLVLHLSEKHYSCVCWYSCQSEVTQNTAGCQTQELTEAVRLCWLVWSQTGPAAGPYWPCRDRAGCGHKQWHWPMCMEVMGRFVEILNAGGHVEYRVTSCTVELLVKGSTVKGLVTVLQ
jgi:hypothetical protein